ncbi:MAG: GldG family protein [Planctomycetes bacterium]|nr:GldG family protein [Planctomycetota bacterium]
MSSRRMRLGLLTLLAAAAGTSVVIITLSVLVRPEARVRWDVSSHGQAGVSERTAEALSSLPEGTRAIAFLRPEDARLTFNGNLVYPRAFARLRSLLEDARIRARGKLELIVLEEFGSPVDWTRWETDLEREPLEVLILDTPGEGRRKFIFNELFTSTDPTPDGQPARLVQERVDSALGDAAIRLVTSKPVRAGIVNGYGQPRTNAERGLRPLIRLIRSEGLDTVEVTGPDTKEEFDLLVVAGQTAPFQQGDLVAAESWISAGKPLFLALGPTAPVEVVQQWNQLLAPAGLRFDTGLVCEARPRAGALPGNSTVATLDISSSQLSGQHPATQVLAESGRAQGLLAARPLALEGGSNNYLRTSLILSSADAWADHDRDYAPSPGEARKSFPLAAAAELWQSEQPLQTGRTVTLGSVASLTGPQLPFAQEFVSGSLRWLAGQDAAPSGLVSLTSLPLRIERADQVRITNLVTLGLPGFTLLLALMVYWRRRR